MEFHFRQIVLGYFHIVFSYIIAFEICHSYEWFFIIHTIVYNFGSGVFVNGIVQLVLHGSEKHFCYLVTRVIVRGCSINIRHLLVKVAFTTTNVSDALQKFTEIAIFSLL